MPRKESMDTMQQISAELAQTPYDLRVEGHTDNVPIHTAEFASNWELSSARATSTARLLLTLHAVTPDRLSAAGYAEFHPVDTNDTAEGRGRNRRVDLVILPRTKTNLAAAGPRRAPPANGARSPTTIQNQLRTKLFDSQHLHNHALAPLAVELGIKKRAAMCRDQACHW